MPRRHSDSPLACIISTSGSISLRNAARARCSSIGSPPQSRVNIWPLEMLGLWGMVSASQPVPLSLQRALRRVQRSRGWSASIQEIGSSGAISLRRMTLRCTLERPGARVYSQAWNAVKEQSLERS